MVNTTLLKALRASVYAKQLRLAAERKGGIYRSTQDAIYRDEREAAILLVAIYDLETQEGIEAVKRFFDRAWKIAHERDAAYRG